MKSRFNIVKSCILLSSLTLVFPTLSSAKSVVAGELCLQVRAPKWIAHQENEGAKIWGHASLYYRDYSTDQLSTWGYWENQNLVSNYEKDQPEKFHNVYFYKNETLCQEISHEKERLLLYYIDYIRNTGENWTWHHYNCVTFAATVFEWVTGTHLRMKSMNHLFFDTPATLLRSIKRYKEKNNISKEKS